LRSGRYVRVDVIDQGVGIPRTHLQRVFDPYFSTKQSGSGLGLATALSIIRRHDGHIDLKSEPGKGSVFTIYLPGVEAEVTLPAGGREALAGELTGHVLLLDDEETVLTTAKEMLEVLGLTVECVACGEEAIAAFKRAVAIGRPFDAVILDLTIRCGMGGEDALRHLRELDPDIRAVVSSGYSTNPVMARYKEHGFNAVARKPYTLTELRNAIGPLLER
jgi:CheY-like chemotaxis protein